MILLPRKREQLSEYNYLNNTMEYQELLFEQHDQTAWISLHRPTKLNALNRALLSELHQLLSHLKEDPTVRVIVLTGSGDKAFVAGADIAEFANFNASQGEELAQQGQLEVFDFIANMPKPVIAAINGYALGGGLELALACHIRLAASNARMGLPETSLGVIPGYGGTQRLAQLIGRGRATELILTCRMMPAEEALQAGLVSQVVSPEELLSTAAKLAEQIQKNSPNAIARALQAIRAGYDEKGYADEIHHFGQCFGHPEFIEGTNAFLAKRKAKF